MLARYTRGSFTLIRIIIDNTVIIYIIYIYINIRMCINNMVMVIDTRTIRLILTNISVYLRWKILYTDKFDIINARKLNIPINDFESSWNNKKYNHCAIYTWEEGFHSLNRRSANVKVGT